MNSHQRRVLRRRALRQCEDLVEVAEQHGLAVLDSYAREVEWRWRVASQARRVRLRKGSPLARVIAALGRDA